MLTERIASDFETFLNAWHSGPEKYDDALDAQIHKWYADILTDPKRKVWPARGIPYFSPSSANSCPRSLYEKLRGAKKDAQETPPHQRRWTSLGTAIGDVIQRDILFAEKHMPGAKFRFERNERNEPMFEDFAKMNAIVTHNGKTFALFGTCDGIMRYVSEDGEVIRIGLEIKSKQTTHSQTSEYSQRSGPKEDHVKQCVCYSIMYGTEAEPINYYAILYVNASKKSWMMTEEERLKNPDIKAHCVEITEDMRNSVLDRLASIVDAADKQTPPPLDIDNFTFNNFKTACVSGLSDEELDVIKRQVDAFMRSGLPDWKKRGYAEVLEQITELRKGAVA